MKKLSLLVVLVSALGCGSDTSITIPENATAEAPDETVDVDGEAGTAGRQAGGAENQLRPRN